VQFKVQSQNTCNNTSLIILTTNTLPFLQKSLENQGRIAISPRFARRFSRSAETESDAGKGISAAHLHSAPLTGPDLDNWHSAKVCHSNGFDRQVLPAVVGTDFYAQDLRYCLGIWLRYARPL